MTKKSQSEAKKPGRPLAGEAPMRQIAIRLPDEMLNAIDYLLEDRMDRPDRTAVIRELLAEALKARKSKGRG